jgi:hypothetical protein
MSFEPIASQTLGSGIATVTFSSIPSTYRDLVLVIVATSTSGGVSARMRFNADSASNYEYVRLSGNGTSASSTAGGLENSARLGDSLLDTTLPAQIHTQIMDYSATDKHTVTMSRGDRAGILTEAITARWPQTTVVNQIEVFLTSGNWGTGSILSLYGIAA